MHQFPVRRDGHAISFIFENGGKTVPTEYNFPGNTCDHFQQIFSATSHWFLVKEVQICCTSIPLESAFFFFFFTG